MIGEEEVTQRLARLEATVAPPPLPQPVLNPDSWAGRQAAEQERARQERRRAAEEADRLAREQRAAQAAARAEAAREAALERERLRIAAERELEQRAGEIRAAEHALDVLNGQVMEFNKKWAPVLEDAEVLRKQAAVPALAHERGEG